MNRAYVLSETYTAVIEQLYTIPKPYRTRYQAVHLLLCGHTQLSAGQVTGCGPGMLKREWALYNQLGQDAYWLQAVSRSPKRTSAI